MACEINAPVVTRYRVEYRDYDGCWVKLFRRLFASEREAERATAELKRLMVRECQHRVVAVTIRGWNRVTTSYYAGGPDGRG